MLVLYRQQPFFIAFHFIFTYFYLLFTILYLLYLLPCSLGCGACSMAAAHPSEEVLDQVGPVQATTLVPFIFILHFVLHFFQFCSTFVYFLSLFFQVT